MIRLFKLFSQQNLGSEQLTLAPRQRFDNILDPREPYFVIVAVAVHLIRSSFSTLPSRM